MLCIKQILMPANKILDTMKSNSIYRTNGMKIIYVLITILCLASITTACNTLPTQSTPTPTRVISIGNESFSENEFISWRCYKNSLSTKVLAEVGYLSANDQNINGFILFDGGNVGDLVSYKRAGLNHRWNWEKVNGDYKYSFVIDPEGNGAYYDFTGAKKETTQDAKKTYKCKK